jgi:hypothetical protein
MRTIRPLIAITLLLCASSVRAADLDLEELLATTKYAGFCGALKQLAAFQETTQMAGGDDLILRFTNTEAARLGVTVENMMQTCVGAVKVYNDFVATIHADKKTPAATRD